MAGDFQDRVSWYRCANVVNKRKDEDVTMQEVTGMNCSPTVHVREFFSLIQRGLILETISISNPQKKI